jgi:hypothetical protein
MKRIELRHDWRNRGRILTPMILDEIYGEFLITVTLTKIAAGKRCGF